MKSIAKYPVYLYPRVHERMMRVLTRVLGWKETIILKTLLERNRAVNEATEYVVLHVMINEGITVKICPDDMNDAIMSYFRYHDAKLKRH